MRYELDDGGLSLDLTYNYSLEESNFDMRACTVNWIREGAGYKLYLNGEICHEGCPIQTHAAMGEVLTELLRKLRKRNPYYRGPLAFRLGIATDSMLIL